jgi:hypothetical protein
VREALGWKFADAITCPVFIRVVSLTKTDAKGKDLKKKLVEVLRAAVDEYKGIYVMNFENMRAAKFREIRMDWKESKYVTFPQVPSRRIFLTVCCAC